MELCQPSRLVTANTQASTEWTEIARGIMTMAITVIMRDNSVRCPGSPFHFKDIAEYSFWRHEDNFFVEWLSRMAESGMRGSRKKISVATTYVLIATMSQITGDCGFGVTSTHHKCCNLPMSTMAKDAPMISETTAMPSASLVMGALHEACVSRSMADTTAPP